jgi:hypothetical protein
MPVFKDKNFRASVISMLRKSREIFPFIPTAVGSINSEVNASGVDVAGEDVDAAEVDTTTGVETVAWANTAG